MSIWIRKKQARKKAAQETKKRLVRPGRPVLNALGIPEDVSGNSARIILLGNSRALIENLLGIADVAPEMIRLTVRGGSVVFYGDRLSLTDVRAGAAAVTGQIDSIELPLALREEAEHD